MRFVKKHRSKYGTTTIFLAIILTAIIFVECTYISMFANLERRITYTSAVTTQVDYYLSSYSRELFRTYGIYAFDIESIDDSIFQEILASNGITDEAVLVVSGIDEFDTEDLRNVISTYYSYRSASILVDYFREQLSLYLSQLDNLDIVETLEDFMETDGARILQNILDGISSVTEVLSDFLKSGEGKEIAGYISDFLELIDYFNHSDPDIGDAYDRGSLQVGIDAIELITDYYNAQSTIIETVAFHPYCAHYATYNFDSRLSDDKTINGTSFSEFHDENLSDVEYILTGLEGTAANNTVAFMIFAFLFVKNMVQCFLDSTLMTYFDAIAEVMSTVVFVATEGAVEIPHEYYEVVCVSMYSLGLTTADLNKVLDGDTVQIFSIEEVYDFEVGYKDIVNYFMNYIPDSLMLERMNTIITRDFEGYVCGIEVECERPLFTIDYSRSYTLYE